VKTFSGGREGEKRAAGCLVESAGRKEEGSAARCKEKGRSIGGNERARMAQLKVERKVVNSLTVLEKTKGSGREMTTLGETGPKIREKETAQETKVLSQGAPVRRKKRKSMNPNG